MKNFRLIPTLALAALLLQSSCVWFSTHKYFYQKGRSGECVAVVANPSTGKADIYQAGGKFYVRAEEMECYERERRYLKTIYEDERAYTPEVLVDTNTARTIYGEVLLKNSGRNGMAWYRTDAGWQKSLPAGATPYHHTLDMEPQYKAPQITDSSINAHAIYAYPLAAVTFVGVDAPLTVLGNVLFIFFGD